MHSREQWNAEARPSFPLHILFAPFAVGIVVHVTEGLSLRPEMLRSGHTVRLLRDGAEAYPAMLSAIRSATSSVLLEMYTFAADSAGRRFGDALIERAKAGIDVRVLYDAIGCRDTPRDFFGELRREGVKVVEFHPYPLGRRNHRKLLVVDGRVAFVGGLNIAREYASTADGGLGWRDTQVEIEGPCVRQLAEMFLELWGRTRKQDSTPAPAPRATVSGGAQVLVLSSQRFLDRWETAQHYRHAIVNARERIWMANPYFLPSARFRRALRKADRRGVDVRILVPGRTDFLPVLYASQRLFGGYLRAGMRLYEWPGTMMHAKTAVIDGMWSTVGSYNIDHLSLLHNYELTAVVHDKGFGRRMEEMFEADFARSREITIDDWKKRGWGRRFLEHFFYQFRTLL